MKYHKCGENSSTVSLRAYQSNGRTASRYHCDYCYVQALRCIREEKRDKVRDSEQAEKEKLIQKKEKFKS